MKRLTHNEIIEMLRKRVAKETAAAVSRDTGASPQNICDVLHGRKGPSQRLLEGMGLRRVILYEVTNRREA